MKVLLMVKIKKYVKKKYASYANRTLVHLPQTRLPNHHTNFLIDRLLFFENNRI